MAEPSRRRYFGTDGIRGRVGESPINAEFVLKLGWAAGRVLAKTQGGPSKVLIGKDTRLSGYMFESALQAGLSAAGVDIRLLGPMPTPAIAYLTRTLHAQAGIVISASHNPYYDNGIKFFSAQGVKLADEIESAIEAELDQAMHTVDSSELGKAERVEDAAGRYIEFCKSTIPSTIEFRDMKIVVDCAHGATYHVAPSVLEELGAEVIPIGVNPDGDGDRVIMVDHKGEVVDGDELLFIIAQSRAQTGTLNGGAVVGTLMSNFGLEQALRGQGIDFKRAAVGDRYVMEMLRSGGWTLGGESSGHIICLDRTTTGDGIVSALQVLVEIMKSGNSLHELKKGMIKYPQCMVNVPVAPGFDFANSSVIQEAYQDVLSALREDGRVLLRPSGTEPVIRVMVEGADSGQVQSLANQLAEVVARAAVNG